MVNILSAPPHNCPALWTALLFWESQKIDVHGLHFTFMCMKGLNTDGASADEISRNHLSVNTALQVPTAVALSFKMVPLFRLSSIRKVSS